MSAGLQQAFRFAPVVRTTVTPERQNLVIEAGAGTGNTPCAQTSVPWPIATLAQVTLAGASQSRAAAVPTTSTIESIAPTSCNVTSSSDVPCSFASARASRSKMSSARVRVPGANCPIDMRHRISA